MKQSPCFSANCRCGSRGAASSSVVSATAGSSFRSSSIAMLHLFQPRRRQLFGQRSDRPRPGRRGCKPRIDPRRIRRPFGQPRSAVRRSAAPASRSSSGNRLTASTASLIERTMKPVTPSSMISAIAPLSQAMTGVPQAIASITTSPNGSGQSIGKQKRRRVAEKRLLLRLADLADIFDVDAVDQRLDRRRGNRRGRPRPTFAAILSLQPGRRRAISMARSGRLSRDRRPRKAR